MCGIVAYHGTKSVLPLLVNGLKRVEYRGYDSAGVAILAGQQGIHLAKCQGKISALEELLEQQPLPEAMIGIAHTRWATHGDPSDRNAHPHLSCDGRVAVVHNGTIENYQELRDLLQKEGHHFTSETDTEILSHLLERFLQEGDLVSAVQKMHLLLKGAYGIAALSADEPNRLIAARHGSPLVVGLADHGSFVASDATAFREHTDRMVFLDDGEMVVMDGPADYRLLTLQNQKVEKDVERLEWDLAHIAKGGFPHFMLKEIMEQPAALKQTLSGRLLSSSKQPEVHLGGLASLATFLRKDMTRIVITACGTSWHAGLIGRRMLEKLLRIPVTVEYASELATGPVLVDNQTLLITVTQSGETKDTIEAAKRAKERGAIVWNICNVVGSTMTRLAHSGMYLHVGPEIGVASTKAFTAQVAAFALFTLALVELRQVPWVTDEGRQTIARGLLQLPDQLAQVLSQAKPVQAIAQEFADRRHALYLGRGYNFPTALEGALKLKEISYIHAEGYPAGEMKHGPIALIDREMPVVVIAPRDAEVEATYQKILGNIEEVAARGGRIILIGNEGDELLATLHERKRVEYMLTIPHTIPMFTTILANAYCQLLAYDIAAIRGCEIDQPRNLAKSVTVE